MQISTVTVSAGAPLRQAAQSEHAGGFAAFREHVDRARHPASVQQEDIGKNAEQPSAQEPDAGTAAQDETLDPADGECDSLCDGEQSAEDIPASSPTRSWTTEGHIEAKLASGLDQPARASGAATESTHLGHNELMLQQRGEPESAQQPFATDTSSAAYVILDDDSEVLRADVQAHLVAAPQEGRMGVDPGISGMKGQAAYRAEGGSAVQMAFIANATGTDYGDNRLRHGGSADHRLSGQDPMEREGLPIRLPAAAQTTTSSLQVTKSLGAFGPITGSLFSRMPDRPQLTEDTVRIDLQKAGATVGHSALEGVFLQLKQTALVAAGRNQAAALRMQVITQIRMANSQTFSLQLSPVELGSVRISMTMTDAGMQMLFQVERPETLELLRRFSSELAQDLRNAGFDMLDLSFAQQKSNQQDQSKEHVPDFVHMPESNNHPDARRASTLSLHPEGRMDLRV